MNGAEQELNEAVAMIKSGEVERGYARLEALSATGMVEAMETLVAVAQQLGRPESAADWVCALGDLKREAGDMAEARVKYEQAASLGSVPGMNNLALMAKLDGNYEKAKHWYQMAADRGSGDAISNLGTLALEQGSEDEAAELFEQAHEAGALKGAYNRGIYARDHGELGEALLWLSRSYLDAGFSKAPGVLLGVLVGNAYDSGMQEALATLPPVDRARICQVAARGEIDEGVGSGETWRTSRDELCAEYGLTVCATCQNVHEEKFCPRCVPADQSWESHPPVTWEEVKDYLVRRLLIDEEWMITGNQSLTWWPWFLEQQIWVQSAGSFDAESSDARDMWMSITMTIRIAELPTEQGIAAAYELNQGFPLGTYVYEDGVLSVSGTLALNNLCRNLLSLFLEAALAQATSAHMVALQLREDGYLVLESAHPTSGIRKEPDGLLALFSGEDRRDQSNEQIVEPLASARESYVEALVSMGAQRGWSNPEVDYITVEETPLLDVAIALPDDAPHVRQFGSGLTLLVRILPPGVAFTSQDANAVNLDLLRWGPITVLGNVSGGEAAEDYGSTFWTYLDAGFLLENYNIGADGLVVSICNAVNHAIGTARVAQSWVYGKPTDPS